MDGWEGKGRLGEEEGGGGGADAEVVGEEVGPNVALQVGIYEVSAVDGAAEVRSKAAAEEEWRGSGWRNFLEERGRRRQLGRKVVGSRSPPLSRTTTPDISPAKVESDSSDSGKWR